MTKTTFISPALPCSGVRGNRRTAVCMTSEGNNEDPGENPTSPQSNSSKPKKTIRSSASWANEFFPGFGRKGPGSRPDWDLRPKSLRSKDEGAGVCDSCKGTGLMTCTFCQGSDFYRPDGAVLKCPACGGKSNVTCSACFGTSKQIELVSYPSVFLNFFSSLSSAIQNTFFCTNQF